MFRKSKDVKNGCHVSSRQGTHVSRSQDLYYYRMDVLKKLYSKFEEFLAGRSQFDNDDGVDFYAPTCCQSATFLRPLFAFILWFFYHKQ